MSREEQAERTGLEGSCLPESATDGIDERTELPRLFALHPETRAVFNRFGLRGCGGAHGPAESIGFFAGAHGVELAELLRQIRQVIADPISQQRARAQLQTDAQPRMADAIYQPFFLAGILTILTVGAAWGVTILWKIGLGGSFTGVSVHEVNAHGHAQIMGWVGLFIMGFAYQAFPRMWHIDLPAPRLALLSGLAVVVSIAARSSAMMFSGATWALNLHDLGVLIELSGVAIFVALLSLALVRSKHAVSPYVAFALTSLTFLVVQSVYSGWHTHALMTAPSRDALLHQISVYQAPLRDVQIHGLAMLMIFAVGIRMFPTMFGLAEVSPRRAWISLGLLLAGIVLESSLFPVFRLTGSHAAAGGMFVAWLLLALGASLVVLPWKLWRPLPEPARADRTGKFVRAAFAWLFVSLALLLLLPVYQVVSRIPFSHAYYGAIRHAITVGFISMMIVGMASKVVPTLRDSGPEQLPRLASVFVLLNLGCFLRVAFQIGTDWHPGFFKLVGISGMLEWTALAIWSAHLVAVMFGWGRYHSDDISWSPAPQQIKPEHRVAAVLHWHPELEPVFVAHGFDMLRNPVLRRTVARQVSLQQVCQYKGVDLGRFLAQLNQSRQPAARDACAGDRLPLVPLTIHRQSPGPIRP